MSAQELKSAIINAWPPGTAEKVCTTFCTGNPKKVGAPGHRARGLGPPGAPGD